MVAVFAAFVHRSVAVEPDVGLAVGSLLGDDLRAVTEVLEDHAVGLRIQPRTRGTADVERRAIGADLRVVDAAAFGQVEALHDAPGSVQQYVLAVDNPVGERGRERSRGVERRLLQRGDRTARRIAAVAGRNDGRAEGAERHQSGLIDRGDRLVGRAPLERDSGIGGTVAATSWNDCPTVSSRSFSLSLSDVICTGLSSEEHPAPAAAETTASTAE